MPRDQREKVAADGGYGDDSQEKEQTKIPSSLLQRAHSPTKALFFFFLISYFCCLSINSPLSILFP